MNPLRASANRLSACGARLEALVRANAAPRCGARCKRTGKPCRAAAMPNGRCKVHGGKSTGPRTPEGLERSGRANWKHGRFSREAKAERSRVRAAILAAPLSAHHGMAALNYDNTSYLIERRSKAQARQFRLAGRLVSVHRPNGAIRVQQMRAHRGHRCGCASGRKMAYRVMDLGGLSHRPGGNRSLGRGAREEPRPPLLDGAPRSVPP